MSKTTTTNLTAATLVPPDDLMVNVDVTHADHHIHLVLGMVKIRLTTIYIIRAQRRRLNLRERVRVGYLEVLSYVHSQQLSCHGQRKILMTVLDDLHHHLSNRRAQEQKPIIVSVYMLRSTLGIRRQTHLQESTSFKINPSYSEAIQPIQLNGSDIRPSSSNSLRWFLFSHHCLTSLYP
mmetsp:Transcript_7127/g.31501  ORF Transcript_7127/g.31501 Transcript_7127/m.31501 type:complete len:179 (+) Transcript_7127:692-1228(+)